MSKRTLWLAGIVILLVAMAVSACGGNTEATAEPTSAAATAETATEDDGGADTATEVPENTPTPTVEEQYPDVLVIHPEAFDIQATPASNTYVYIVPGLVAETTEYMLAELTALGWEGLGKPTLMGHLATINLQMGKSRLTVSMQDNERTETTRVQMTLVQ